MRTTGVVTALLYATCAAAQVITTVAGTDFIFPNSVPALNAPLGNVASLATDSIGNVYAADSFSAVIVEISPNGTLTAIAGSANGLPGSPADGVPATNAGLTQPLAVAVDQAGNFYFSDAGRIREVSDGTVTTIAGMQYTTGFSGDGGPATSAMVDYTVNAIVVDRSGAVYFAENDTCRIRKVASGIISTFAGNGHCAFSGDGGPANSASLGTPVGLALDSQGNLYIADLDNARIRKVSGGVISTVAGGPTNDPTGLLGDLSGVALDSSGNLYVAVSVYGSTPNRVYKVTGNVIKAYAGNGQAVLSGDGGPALSASLNNPRGLALDASGNLYIADTSNLRIRRVTANGIIGPVAGNSGYRYSGDGGAATSATFNTPGSVALDAAGNLYIADTGNHVVRKVSQGTVTTFAGNHIPAYTGDNGPAASASLDLPMAVAVDSGGSVYIADYENDVIRKVAPGGTITTVAGNGNSGFSGDGGPATAAMLSNPTGVAVDLAGNIYIADGGNDRVRKVSASTGIITTFAGNGMRAFSGDNGPATMASLQINPYSYAGLALDPSGSLYIADNTRVREVAGGNITTVAGNGQSGSSGDGGPALQAGISPAGLLFDGNGSLYISDTERVRKVTNGTITTFAGNGNSAFSGDGGLATAAGVYIPEGLAIDAAGNIYIAEIGDNRVREVLKTAPSFQVSPTSFSLSAMAFGASPAANFATLTSSTPGLPYTTFSTANWLSVSPAAGSAPATLQVNIDPSQLSAGTYQGQVDISAPNALPATRTLTVVLAVSPPVASGLAVSSSSLSFSATQGAGSQTAQLTVLNQGGGTINFTATATAIGGNWLQVSPSTGAVTAGSPAAISVTITPGPLTPGTYNGTIIVGSAGATQTIAIPVTLAIGAPQQEILLSQSGLTFTAVAQGGKPLPQSLSILNTGAGTLDYTVTVSTNPPASGWLFVSAGSGTVNRPFLDVSTVQVSVDASGLAAGTYFGQVQVSSPGAGNSPQVTTVALIVLPPGSNPGPDVSPIGLVFTPAHAGSQSIAVANVTANPITFGSSVAYPSNTGFVNYVPTNATVLPNVPAQIDVETDFTSGNLMPGANLAALTLAFSDGSIRTVSILAVVPPSGASGSSVSKISPRASGCTPTKLLPEFTLVGYSGNVPFGYPAGVAATIVDDCGTPMTEGTVVVSFSNGDPALSLQNLQGGNWTNTWVPGNMAANVTLTLRASVPAQNLAGSTQSSVSLQQGSQNPPILSGAPLGAGTLAQGPFSPGDVILLKGNGLADGAAGATATPLGTSLQGASLLIGSQPAPLLYADSSRVIGLVPANVPVNESQQVLLLRDNTYANPASVIFAPTHPAILTADGSGQGQALVYNASPGATTLANGTNPAAAGNTVIIYCTGLGATDATGKVSNPVTVLIGGQAANVSYAGTAQAQSYPAAGAPMFLGVVSGALGGLYQVTATVPGGVASGLVSVSIGSAGQTSQAGVTMNATGTGSLSAGLPAINAAGVVAVDSAQTTIEAGEFVSVFGTNLGPASGVSWNGVNFVTSLGGTSVTIDGNPAYLTYATSGQVNVQAPNDATNGPVSVVVTTPAGSTTSTVTLAPFAPSFLLLDSKHIAGIILRQDGSGAYGGGAYDILGPTGTSLGYATVAAKAGDNVELFAIGLGPTTPPIQAGQAFSGAAPTNSPVSLTINGTGVTQSFAGFSAALAYQINLTIPAGLGTGDMPIAARVGGSQTPSGVVISLQ